MPDACQLWNEWYLPLLKKISDQEFSMWLVTQVLHTFYWLTSLLNVLKEICNLISPKVLHTRSSWLILCFIQLPFLDITYTLCWDHYLEHNSKERILESVWAWGVGGSISASGRSHHSFLNSAKDLQNSFWSLRR